MEFISSTLYVPGMTGNGLWALYKASGHDGAFSIIPAQPGITTTSRVPHPVVKRGSDTQLYTVLDLQTAITAPGSVSFNNAEKTDINPNNETRYLSTEDDGYNSIVGGKFGLHYLGVSSESQTGTKYIVNGVQAQAIPRVVYPRVDGDPPGAGSTPPYFPPFNNTNVGNKFRIDLTLTLKLVDQNNVPVWQKEFKFHTLDTQYGYQHSFDNGTPNLISYYVQYVINETISPPIENVYGLEVSWFADSNVSGLIVWERELYTLPEFSMEFFVDPRLSITQKSVTGKKLYRINPNFNTWVDITPSGQKIPTHPDALAASGQQVRLIATEPAGKRRFITSNLQGDLWTEGRTTKYYWLKRLAENVYLTGGDSKLDLSLDDLDTFEQRIGTWLRDIGTVGTIEGALVLVEQSE
jgi:hypothetical protein